MGILPVATRILLSVPPLILIALTIAAYLAWKDPEP